MSAPGSRRARSRRAPPTDARLLALRVLMRVEQAGAYADLALRAALGRSALPARDRALATELVLGTLRWRGRLDFLLAHVLERDVAELEPGLATLLRLGAFQIAVAERIPVRAAVDESVRCARAAGFGRAAGLANAALRRLAREHATLALPALDADPLAHLVHSLSIPRWIAERWLARFGPAEAAELARASNEVPPLVVRANRLRTDREQLLAELRERFADAHACRFAPDGIVLGRGGDPGGDPAFRDGRFTVQDEGSQLVVELLDPRPGERVLDACAAPGGKATASAERTGERGSVVALDRNRRRVGLVARDARRLGLASVLAVAADASRPLPVADGRLFDRALVDAPCSGLGTLRRNPDLRWRLRPGDPGSLAALQRSLLDRAAGALRPGGVLVYSTCTLLEEENEGVVSDFLARHDGFRQSAARELPAHLRPLADADGFVRTLPHRHDADGFVMARLERVR
ncbi:MAG TPA: 16S rRNA (cytosine(967)-C(5))-methyltransferase RsmB [Myxococcota bacterium]|nr:16S rRNA (cytosine(967)-C(5))-methyltransferase RsmB [Myxococcota bacterium]